MVSPHHHREDQKMKRKRRIDPAKARRRSASLEQDGRWRRLEYRVAALENIAGFLFAQMSDDQKRLVESDWNDCGNPSDRLISTAAVRD